MFYTRLDVGFVLSHLLFLYVSYKKHAAFFLVNGNQLHSTQFKTPFFLNLWVNLIHGCSLIVGIVFDIVFSQACKRFWGPSDQEGRYLFFPVTSSNPNLVLEYFLSSLLLAFDSILIHWKSLFTVRLIVKEQWLSKYWYAQLQDQLTIILLQDFIINFLRNIFTSVAPQIDTASLGGHRNGYKQKILQLH